MADSKRVRNRLILKGRQNALAGILSKECASESHKGVKAQGIETIDCPVKEEETNNHPQYS